MKRLATITDKDVTGSDALSNAAPSTSVNAVLFDQNGHVALCYFGKFNFHTIIGGGVEASEDMITAVKREVLEEAGCDCEIVCEIGYTFENRAEHDNTLERYYYIARVVGEKGELQLTEKEMSQKVAVCWYPLEQALQIIKENNSLIYQQKFIQKRDIIVLTEVIGNHAHLIGGAK